MLTALPRVGQFGDPKSEEMLAKFLIDRRDAIVRRYLPAVNPIVDVQLDDSGRLTFKNAAVDADLSPVPAEYVVSWQRFDNATRQATPFGSTSAPGKDTSVAAPPNLPSAVGAYVRAEISASGGPESWAVPAHAYFRRETSGWKLVGFERVPTGNRPLTAPTATTTSQQSATTPREDR